MSTLPVAADHPAFAGHFPGVPVLPAVVLLDLALHRIDEVLAGPAQSWRLVVAKFLSPVQPGDSLRLTHEALPNGSVRFAIWTGERAVANGLLAPKTCNGEGRGEQS